METSSSKSHNNNNNNNNNNHSPEKRKANESTVFGVTKSESVRGCLHWKIVRFKDLDKRVGEYCESPEFTVGDYKWSLFLYPNGSKDDAKNYISIFLSCLNIFHEVTINFTVTFISINSSGDKVLGPIKKTFGEDELDWGWSKALDHQAMNACFLNNNNNNVNNNNNNSNNNNNNNNSNNSSNSNNSNYNNCNEVDEGCLFVKCDVEVFGEWRTALESESSIRVPSCSVREDFDRLLVEHPHADVLFKVQDHDFHSHKAILSVRSSVFRGMFASSMREGREGVVVVDDVEPAVFKELLKFIYTGCCSKLIEERPLDILTVADKYDLPRLKLLSEELLLRRLTMANAPSTLSHADMFHATQLKKCVLEFIANRFFEVIGTEGFKEWTIDNPHLISEIHEYMVGKSNSKAESTGQSKSKKSVQKRRRTST